MALFLWTRSARFESRVGNHCLLCQQRVMGTMNGELDSIMAATIFLRFNRDHEAARAAWSRMLQNYGWDTDKTARKEWEAMVANGLRYLRSGGWVQ